MICICRGRSCSLPRRRRRPGPGPFLLFSFKFAGPFLDVVRLSEDRIVTVFEDIPVCVGVYV